MVCCSYRSLLADWSAGMQAEFGWNGFVWFLKNQLQQWSIPPISVYEGCFLHLLWVPWLCFFCGHLIFCEELLEHTLLLMKKSELMTSVEPYKFVLDLDEGMFCLTYSVAFCSWNETESFFPLNVEVHPIHFLRLGIRT